MPACRRRGVPPASSARGGRRGSSRVPSPTPSAPGTSRRRSTGRDLPRRDRREPVRPARGAPRLRAASAPAFRSRRPSAERRVPSTCREPHVCAHAWTSPATSAAPIGRPERRAPGAGGTGSADRRATRTFRSSPERRAPRRGRAPCRAPRPAACASRRSRRLPPAENRRPRRSRACRRGAHSPRRRRRRWRCRFAERCRDGTRSRGR